VSETLPLAGLDFLAPAPGLAPARSPLAAAASADGAQLGLRGGWEVPVTFADPEAETRAIAETVGVADASQLPTYERQGAADLVEDNLVPAGGALRRAGAWLCPFHARRALVVDGPSPGSEWLDVTSAYAGLSLLGPLGRDVFARISALDLRPSRSPVGALRPGSVARTPAIVLRESDDVYLLLFGAAYAEYMWTTVLDAARRLGGAPVGVDSARATRLAALGEAGDDA